jgi:hypothetical protein
MLTKFPISVIYRARRSVSELLSGQKFSSAAWKLKAGIGSKESELVTASSSILRS